MPPPIAVFAYRRAPLLARTLDLLERCEGFAGRRVHVFCDAPSGEKAGAEAAVDRDAAAVRALAAEWCRRQGARLVVREAHLGLRNLTEGISELCAAEGAAISLEEDHQPAPDLLLWLDRALTRYAGEEQVHQVTGFMMGLELPAQPATFFLPLPMPAGWGTWERAWRAFSWDVGDAAAAVLDDPERRRAFDLGGAYPASRLLERVLAGGFESYFLRWYLAMFARGGLALCPHRSLVWNGGLDSGLHAQPAGPARDRLALLLPGPPEPTASGGLPRGGAIDWDFPPEVTVDPGALLRVRAFLRGLKG